MKCDKLKLAAVRIVVVLLFIGMYLNQSPANILAYANQTGDSSISSTEVIKNPELSLGRGVGNDIRFTLPNSNYFEASVPSGAITSEPVRIWIPDGVIGLIKKDEEPSIIQQEIQLTEPGKYQVALTFMDLGTEAEFDSFPEAFPEAGTESNPLIYEVEHNFTILDQATNKYRKLTSPDGFQIASCTKAGKAMKLQKSQTISFEDDGFYEICFADRSGKGIQFSTSISIDTKAPALLFSQDITQGVVKAPLEFASSEAFTTIFVSYNGNREKASTQTLTVPGHYRLEVFDIAGNRSCYELEIRKSWKIFEPQMVIMTILILVCVILQVITQRRNMKVL